MRPRSALLLLLAVFFTEATLAQRLDGELEVVVSTAKYVSVDASGNVVGGTWRAWYPATHAYDNRSRTTAALQLLILDRTDPPGTGTDYFARGAYVITIDGSSVVMDYRDADYEDGGGDHNCGTDYENPDMKVYYNCGDSCFYRDSAFRDRIYGSIGIWEGGRKNPAVPKIPVTVTNSFGGGDVIVAGSSQVAPRQVKWTRSTGYTIAALSPQTYNGVIYQFESWSDAGDSSHQVTATLDLFSTVFTARFTAVRPERVTGFEVTGYTDEHPHLSWDIHPDSNVNYYIYRKVRHNAVVGSEVLIDTLAHSATSYDDLEYTVVGHSSDLLAYDARAHHTPSNTMAESWFMGGLYGEILEKPRGGGGETSQEKKTPEQYGLAIHPNPFNPSTRITFTLPAAGRTTLSLYDVLGKEVAMLLGGEKPAGTHSVQWDASGFPSGMYIARFAVTDVRGATLFARTQKLLLAK